MLLNNVKENINTIDLPWPNITKLDGINKYFIRSFGSSLGSSACAEISGQN